MEPDEIRALVKAVEARSGPGVEMLPGTLQEVNDTQGVVLLDGTTQPAGVNVVTECEPGDRVMVLFVPPRGGFVVGRFAVAGPESYRFVEQLRFTTPGTSTFDRSLYPWLRAVRVKVIGGGGGSGGGSSTASNRNGGGSGGGGGGYAESFVVATDLPATVPVTVGAGGAGAVGAANGSTGGVSEFGTGGSYRTRATGGVGGLVTISETGPIFRRGGFGGVGTHGDLQVLGHAGQPATGVGPSFFITGGAGGGTVMGGGGVGGTGPAVNTFADGNVGGAYGGGGGGPALRANAGTRGGQPGAAGIVIVDLYA